MVTHQAEATARADRVLRLDDGAPRRRRARAATWRCTPPDEARGARRWPRVSARLVLRAARGVGVAARPAGPDAADRVGIFAAGLVLGVALTVPTRCRPASTAPRPRRLPTIVARFADQDPREVDAIVRALPNLASASYRYEQTGVRLRAGGHRARPGRGRRSCAAGGAATPWSRAATYARRTPGSSSSAAWPRVGPRPGDRVRVGRLGRLTVAGVAVSPTTSRSRWPRPPASPRRAGAARALRRPRRPAIPINMALLWARDPSRTDVLVSAARQSSFGLRCCAPSRAAASRR